MSINRPQPSDNGSYRAGPLTAIRSANELSRQAPAPAGFINSAMFYDYMPGAIYELHTSPRFISTIALRPGEKLISKAAGDTVRSVETGAIETGPVEMGAIVGAGRDLVTELARLPVVHRARVVQNLSIGQRNELRDRWRHWAHDGQYPPAGDWRIWLIRAGRGFGKTRAGAEWVYQIARADPTARIALVGSTADDVRRVMIEGESGLIRVARDDEAPVWRGAVGELHFDNGAKAYAYSAEAPEALRGPEHGFAWCDELAKWRYGDATWDNLMMGLRLGDRPRALVTTTPRPIALMRRVMALPDMVETRGRTTGGPVSPGRAYVVGERGPEMFVPSTSGRVETGAPGGVREVRVAIIRSSASITCRGSCCARTRRCSGR